MGRQKTATKGAVAIRIRLRNKRGGPSSLRGPGPGGVPALHLYFPALHFYFSALHFYVHALTHLFCVVTAMHQMKLAPPIGCERAQSRIIEQGRCPAEAAFAIGEA